jgi:adenylate cyclase
VISRWSREALFKATTVYSNQPEGEVRSILAIPLILNAKIIGVFGALNSSSPRGFSHEDRRMLTAITSQIDTAIFERLERRKLRKVMSRSVDPKVLEHLLQNTSDNVLTGERMVLSVIFADIRGSTEWAERTTPEELVMLLNTFLSRMTDVIFKHGGTLDKFVGDEVIALFGSPIPMPDHALRAARTALEMQQAHQALVNEFRKQEKELPLMGVGISSGEVIAGEFGPPIRTDYTAIGRVMNLGARLCSVAGGGQILISPSTYHTVRDQVEVNKKEPISLKGIGQPVPVFELLRIKE